MAFAIEASREALVRGEAPAGTLRELFLASLSELLQSAMHPSRGDPAFQALVLRAHCSEVDEHARLSAMAEADRRAVSAAVGAIAHPGKLRSWPDSPMRQALARLYGLASAGAWGELLQATRRLLGQALAPEDRLKLQALQAHPGLARLARVMALEPLEAVTRYHLLRERHGPRAGSGGAAAKGAAANRRGVAAEMNTVEALRAVADVLNRCEVLAERRDPAHRPARYRVVDGLLVPSGFPGSAERAKSEWDVAIVREVHGQLAAELLLLAEVKASPDAAAGDLPRLLRSLERMALADAETDYVFRTSDAELRLAGASLRRLGPADSGLPPQVIYCCDAPVEPAPMLSAVSRGVLLSEPVCLAFAGQLGDGKEPDREVLHPVWERLIQAPPPLRSVLNQYQTARSARDAMVHPEDLVASLRRAAEEALPL
ncbi:hypothetical protein OOT46_24645 [Aquabacterium sp. A7-Y]|uniref:hypothetical protein n=1 Tax=Aquabacterium sp. A7-Y TaxID=1349605 RepID=UPI00223E137D|nr:hypothetical protein [Aquabacterium sp. A7-Y]MCW7541015.1 hypothetical protein [Aquabacterium sp. A7-Y]